MSIITYNNSIGYSRIIREKRELLEEKLVEEEKISIIDIDNLLMNKEQEEKKRRRERKLGAEFSSVVFC